MQANTSHFAGRITAFLRGPTPVVLLLVCHVALGVSAISRKSLTFDEGLHLTGGTSYWAANDYRLHPENGNWSQRWSSLPLTLCDYQFPPLEGHNWQTSNLWEVSDQFLFESHNDLDALLLLGRAMMAATSVALALVVYVWSRRLFGPYGGLISLTLYAFSPTMLANGFLTTSDLCVALFFAATTWAQWSLLHRVTPLRLVVACLAVSGLLLSKFSGALILPVLVALAAIRLFNPEPLHVSALGDRAIGGRLRQFAVFVGLAIAETLVVALAIWASYGFRYSAFSPAASNDETQFRVPWDEVDSGLPRHFAAAIRFARNHHLLPEAYLYGFAFTIFSTARFAFLDGQSSRAGWISFFPECFALKTPLGVFLLLGLAAWGGRVYRARAAGRTGPLPDLRPAKLYPLAPLLVLLGVYWAFALSSSLNIGHRHILPTYPPLFILAGAVATWFQTPPSRQAELSPPQNGGGTAVVGSRLVSLIRVIIICTLMATALEAIWFWPHYLAYFNALAGGPAHAYRRLVDSSLDWGQDLKELKRWLDDHPNDTRDARRVYLAYFGMARPEYYGIEARSLPGFRPRWHPHVPRPLTGGLYCVSATMLQSVYLKFPGHWNVIYEQGFQHLCHDIEPSARAGTDLATFERLMPHLTAADVQTGFQNYEDLRLGRLCSFLRQREPDDEVGYSILIYRLTDDDIARALGGDPSELLPKPETVD
jgi:hypothetical protein